MDALNPTDVQDAVHPATEPQPEDRTTYKASAMALIPDLFLKNLQRLEEENRMLKLRLQQQQELMSEGFLAFQQSAEELRIKIKGEAQNYLAHIFESLPVGVIVTSPQGRITAINQTGSALLGHKTPQLLGKSAQKLLKLPHSPKMAITKNARQHTITWQTPLHESRTIHISISPLLGSGKTLGFLLNMEDMTLIHKLKKEAQMQERLAAMGQVAAHISHEIRNPLGSIGLFTSLIQKNLPPDDNNQQLLTHISRGVSSMNHILTDLLQYTSPKKITLLKNDLNPLLTEIIDFNRYLATENHLLIKTNLDKKPQLINADNLQLKQCLQNLLLNAIQAAKQHATIQISSQTKTITETRQLRTLGLSQPASVCEIQIINESNNIPQHVIKQLFEPFFTTKTHGTGLGLTIAQQIIRQHQGDIFAQNTPQGTCFTIRLPLIKPLTRRRTVLS